jgi:phosphatidylglycerol lysyltransferase
MLSLLLRPRHPEPTLPDEEDLDRLQTIARASDTSIAWLSLLGDKQILFNDERSAFLMYGVEGRTWVAMADPIGPAAECTELAWRYRELVDRHGGLTAFYQVSESHLSLYIDLGLTLHRLGEVGRVPLTDFTLDGAQRKALRYQVRRCEDKLDCEFEVMPEDQIEPLLSELHAVSDAWLEARDTREKSFSLGRFEPNYVARTPVAVVRRHGHIVAFANLWPAAVGTELSVDLMRYNPDAPSGAMDYLFTRLMLWGREQGYAWFNLGMTPFTGFERHELAPLWNRFGDLLFRYGENFYNFRGLRQYKEKFDPTWEPRYLACAGGHALPRILTNIATLISGGVGGLVGK